MTKLYHNFLYKLTVKENQTIDSEEILKKIEAAKMNKEFKIASLWAILLAFSGVALYYLPLYYWLFLSKKSQFIVFDFPIEIAVYDLLLCLLLTVLEIYLLTLVHLKMVHNIAVISGYINSDNKSQSLEQLEKIATGKKNKDIIKYGLDPFQDTNKTTLFFINTLAKAKGFLANKVCRYLIKRFAGRYAIKYTLDFVGAPIYMLLNFWATKSIYQNTKAEIYGLQLIDQFMAKLKKEPLTENQKKLVYDVLQLIAISKQDYHPNHAVLAHKIISFYAIPIKTKHLFTDDFYHEIATESIEIKKLIASILVIGFVLDGKISNTEKQRIKHLYQNKIIPYNESELKTAAQQFMQGRPVLIINLKSV